jgi:hypothetical protein
MYYAFVLFFAILFVNCCLVIAEIMACARDPKSRDRDVGQVVRDETETRPWVGLETVSRPRRRDRDHIPAYS